MNNACMHALSQVVGEQTFSLGSICSHLLVAFPEPFGFQQLPCMLDVSNMIFLSSFPEFDQKLPKFIKLLYNLFVLFLFVCSFIFILFILFCCCFSG